MELKFKQMIQSIRLPFLVLTPVCVFLGLSVVIANNVNINYYFLALALTAALLAHISVNTFNEYFDFKSGLDLLTKRTPFSGGSGHLPQNPANLNSVFIIAISSLLAVVIIGVFFIWQYGLEIIPLGLIGLTLILTYTSWINKYPLLCLLTPGIGFGFIMVIGTQFILTGSFLPLSWFVALVPFFLTSNLLLLNQYPDITADRSVGRNHFPIAYGVRKSNFIYASFVIATIIVIVTGIINKSLPSLGLISLIPIPLALFSLSGAIRYGKDIGVQPQFLAANVAVSLFTPLLLGISLIYG